MKHLNTFFVALFFVSTLVYLTGCDKTNTLVYTPVGKQYSTNQFNVTSTNPALSNVTVTVQDSNLLNAFTPTSTTVYTTLTLLGHLPGATAARDTVKTTLQFGTASNTTYTLTSNVNTMFGTVALKNTDSTFKTYTSINGLATVTTSGYGILGEYINGTYAGKFASGVDTLTISNGQFSCFRRQ